MKVYAVKAFQRSWLYAPRKGLIRLATPKNVAIKARDPNPRCQHCYTNLELLKEFLPSSIRAAEAYSKEAGALTEIIVIDDGSSDNWDIHSSDGSSSPQ